MRIIMEAVLSLLIKIQNINLQEIDHNSNLLRFSFLFLEG